MTLPQSVEKCYGFEFRIFDSESPDFGTYRTVEFDYSKYEKDGIGMKVWTVQPLFVYEQLKEGKTFRCDFRKSPFEDMEEFHNAYRWMTEQMKKRIGPPPVGVEYPIWAWHTRGWKHKKPDLRSSDMRHFTKPHVCIELDVPDEDIVLSDFDAWHFVLNDFCNPQCSSEREYEQWEQYYDSLSTEEQKKARVESWNKIFDVTPRENEWNRNGEYIQATFWEIKPEYVVDVRYIRRKKE